MGGGVGLISFPQRFTAGWSEHPRVLSFSPVRALIRDSTASQKTKRSMIGADVG